MKSTCLCPKEVGKRLGISTRSAQRLMHTNRIRSFQAGPRLLRTTHELVEEYMVDQLQRRVAEAAR